MQLVRYTLTAAFYAAGAFGFADRVRPRSNVRYQQEVNMTVSFFISAVQARHHVGW